MVISCFGILTIITATEMAPSRQIWSHFCYNEVESREISILILRWLGIFLHLKLYPIMDLRYLLTEFSFN